MNKPKWKDFHFLLLIILFWVILFFLYACQGQVKMDNTPVQVTNMQFPTVISGAPLATQTPLTWSVHTETPIVNLVPTSESTRVACQSCQACQLTTSAVSWYQWSTTGDQLVYEFKYKDGYWAFDIQENVTYSITQRQMEKLLISQTVFVKIPDDIREHQQTISPSGKRIMFFRERELSPTPTRGPGEGTGPVDLQSEIFVLENKENAMPLSIGYIDGLVERFVWFPDETRVLVIPSHRLLGTAYAWIADVSSARLQALFPVGGWQQDIGVKVLSPDGNTLVFTQGDSIHLYDIDSGSERKIPDLSVFGRDYYWFVSENRLLIVDDFKYPLDFLVAVFDLDSNALCHRDETVLHIRSIELSPNHDYLAILWDETSNLYILPLCDLCVSKQ